MAKNVKKVAAGTGGDQRTAPQGKPVDTISQGGNQGAENIGGQEPSSNPVGSPTASDHVMKSESSGAVTEGEAQQRPVAMAAILGIHAINVSAPHDGYRRAGRVWGRSAIQVPLHELSDTQLKHLHDDARLIVAPVRGADAQDEE